MNSPTSLSVNGVSQDTEREAFEAWAHAHLGQGYKLDRDEEDGVYIYPVPRWAFRAWKAGRAAIAVQSPAASQPSDAAYHSLKTDPVVFDAVWNGAKTFEIRLNDRGFKVGDVLNLRETTHSGADIAHGAPLVYTGRELDKRVSHVLTGYGLMDGWCCLSFAAAQAPAASQPSDGLEHAFRQLDERARQFAESHDREENEYAMGITDAVTIIRAALAVVQGKK